MRIRTEKTSGPAVKMTPLIDIMFTLIIFFLATATFQEEERDIAINVPSNTSGTTLSNEPKVIVINVKKDGSYKIGDTAMKLDQIKVKLEEAVRKDPGQKVLVRGDRNALHGDVAAAVAAAKGAGVNESLIGYKAEPL
ncbi:MAG: biopolymer transporter ExbD [Verrucomicrobiota bacterium]|jgi:biopolymer transport protein ExbD|nr:biopolymer transporter ExbD [Verrucomicrobiota bacterium]